MDERDLYPGYAADFTPETQAHEVQVRYLRDALTVLVRGQFEVSGNQVLLGWDGERAVYAAPDVMVFYHEVRGIIPLPPNPHPNPHPMEQGRRFELAIDVSGRRATPNLDVSWEPSDLVCFGVGAYLYYDLESRTVAVWRLVDRTPIPVQENPNGRYYLADLDMAFGVDRDGFLRAYGMDGQEMPRYEESVRRSPSAYDIAAEAKRLEARRQTS